MQLYSLKNIPFQSKPTQKHFTANCTLINLQLWYLPAHGLKPLTLLTQALCSHSTWNMHPLRYESGIYFTTKYSHFMNYLKRWWGGIGNGDTLFPAGSASIHTRLWQTLRVLHVLILCVCNHTARSSQVSLFSAQTVSKDTLTLTLRCTLGMNKAWLFFKVFKLVNWMENSVSPWKPNRIKTYCCSVHGILEQ